jgi:hypothetical protein
MTAGLIGLAVAGKIYYSTEVVLVDAKTGDVLFLDGYQSKGIPKDKIFDKSFKKIASPK